MAKKKLQTLKVESVNEGVNAAQVANTEKGSVQNPYTIAELETMLEAGTWQGGYVESVGYNEEENNGLEYGLDGYDGYGYRAEDGCPLLRSGKGRRHHRMEWTYGSFRV